MPLIPENESQPGIIEYMSYLIDGHNLIPKLGLHLDSPDDELELIAILQEFTRLSRKAVEVYFDGAPIGQAGSHSYGSVIAHFVRLNTTADAAIRLRLDKLKRAAGNWIVVSSDHEVQDTARALHAKVISSVEFASRIKNLPRSIPNSQVEIKLSSDEVNEWLKLFQKSE